MEQQQDMIYGCHAILEALQECKPIDQILIKKQSDNEQIREIIYLARKQNVTIKSVPIEKLNKITRKAHQGIIAFMSPIEFQDLEQIVPTLFEQGKNPFIIILDQVCDVRNFGAITRTAECMGVHAIVIPQRGAAKIGADAVKTSAGALFKIPICKVSSLKVPAIFFGSQPILSLFSTSLMTGLIFESGAGVTQSCAIYEGYSIASVSVAAHECGHAIQDKVGYTPMRISSALVPIVNFSTKIGYLVIMIGLAAGMLKIALIGIELPEDIANPLPYSSFSI